MGFRMERIRITNICCKCKHWDECFKYRYGNKPQDYMKKYIILYTNGVQDIIYAEDIESAISQSNGSEGYEIKLVYKL